MKIRIVLLILLFLVEGLSGFSWAEENPVESASTLETMAQVIDKDIEGLRRLHEQIQKGDAPDIEALEYRLDGRSFALLTDLNTLVGKE